MARGRSTASGNGNSNAGKRDSSGFLDAITELEELCERHTLERLPHMGEKASRCREALGQCLEILSGIAACEWGCLNEDHILEYIVGRATTLARASFRLFQRGYYDESLALTRNLGEIANLLTLFDQQSNALNIWKALDEKGRKAQFGPVKVRIALESTGLPLIVGAERYSLLSGLATHVTPSTAPQRHNPERRAILAPVFQEVGCFVCLNELALPIVFICFAVTNLFSLDKAKRIELLRAGRDLIAVTGGVTVDRLDDLYKSMDDPREKKERN